ncbi:MAG: hypothetical protein V4702_02350 [Patescibacteria group bacterium]
MAENFPGIGPDFSSLAEISPPTPEKKDKKKDKKESKKPVFESIKQSEKDGEKIKDDKPEKKEPTEKEAPLQKMGEAEQKLAATEIAKDLIEERKDEVEAAPADSIEEKVALVAASFDEALVQEIADGKELEAALENSSKLTLEIVGIEAGESIAEPTESEAENTDTEEVNVPSETSEPTEETEKDDSTASAATTPSALPSGPTGPTPPVPPHGTGPAGPSSPGGGAWGPTGPGGAGFTGGNIPHPTPNITASQAPEYINVRRSNRRHLLVGGLVGYMIGRRRGRIKTEKKLLPIQQKLEKEVKTLEQKIITREERIRTITREQLTQKPEMQHKLVERLQASRELKADAREKPGKVLHKEKIGKFALAGERPFSQERERQLSRFEQSNTEMTKEQIKPPEPVRAPEKPKTVELMAMADLLLIAEHVKIEGSSVKRLYETNRLNPEGLRRVVKAYLRGEHYELTIHDNLITPEQFVFAETLQKTAKPGTSAQSVHGGGAQVVQDDISQSNLPVNNGMSPNSQAVPQSPPTVQQKKQSHTGVKTASVVGAVALIIYLMML